MLILSNVSSAFKDCLFVSKIVLFDDRYYETQDAGYAVRWGRQHSNIAARGDGFSIY